MNLCWTDDNGLITVGQVEIRFAFIPTQRKHPNYLQCGAVVTHHSFSAIITTITIICDVCCFYFLFFLRTVWLHMQCATMFTLFDLHLWIKFVAPIISQLANFAMVSDIRNDSPRPKSQYALDNNTMPPANSHFISAFAAWARQRAT